MAAKTAWPTSTELTNAIAGLGGSVPAGFSAEDIIEAATQQFELETGFDPWLPESSDSTRYYNPEGRATMSIPAYWTITSVTTGVQGGSSGTVLTLGTDYWQEPYRDAADKIPCTRLRFLIPPTGYPQSIKIIGKRGHSDAIPNDAWQAVLSLGCASLLMYAAGTSGSVSEIRQGLVTVKYGDGEESTVRRLMGKFNAAVMRYKPGRVS